jgi:hypothetical protein
VRVRLDKQATSISLLVGLGVRQDGQKVLLAVKNMGRESEAAWRALDDLVKRGLKTPGLVIVDGASGLEKALAALWSDMPVQRCTVHKNRTPPNKATGARRTRRLLVPAKSAEAVQTLIMRAEIVVNDAVGKDTVSRVWRKAKGDWDAWNARLLADEPIVRLILDGSAVGWMCHSALWQTGMPGSLRARSGIAHWRCPPRRCRPRRQTSAKTCSAPSIQSG